MIQSTQSHRSIALLSPVRHWLNNFKIQNAQLARWLCQLIPAQCPFDRDIKLWSYTLIHIPPLCKLNPLYEELVWLRFRALSYLVDECGEDIHVTTASMF